MTRHASLLQSIAPSLALSVASIFVHSAALADSSSFPPAPDFYQSLESHGIQTQVVVVDRLGKQAFPKRIKAFTLMLDRNRHELITRKLAIKKVVFADWASFDPDTGTLVLSVDLSEAELKRYLKSVDRRVAFHLSTGVKLKFDIDLEPTLGAEPHDFVRLEQWLGSLEKKASQIWELRSLVDEIEVGSSTEPQRAGKARLRGENIEEELDSWLSSLSLHKIS